VKRLVGAGAVGVLLVAAATAGGSTPRLAFSEPVTVISSPHGVAKASTGEPRVLVTRTGRVLVSAQFQQWDCATRRPSTSSQMCVWASDDGRRFRIVGGSNQGGDDVDFLETAKGTVLMTAMGNPRVGPSSTGTGLLGSLVLRSADHGRTWSEQDDVNTQVANDRPFLVATPRAAVLSYLGIPGSIEVVRSTDDGRTWGPPQVVVPTPPPGVLYENDTPAWDARHHELLVPYASGSQAYCAPFSGAAGCIDRIALATSRDEGLTWSQEPVVTLSEQGITTIVSLAVDAAGRRTLAFTAARGFSPGTAVADRDVHVYVTSSAGPGAPWSPPRYVGPAGGSSMMPMLTADRPGHVSLAYYASAWSDAGNVARPWDLVVADGRDGGRRWTTTTVAHDAYLGSASNHQSVIWDLVGLTHDQQGRLVVVWTDQLGKAGGPTVVRLARQVSP
jgi:hypothetical protein